MRIVRKGLTAATIVALGGWLAGGAATADPSGVGSASARTTVVAVDLGADGSLLAVRLLADEAGATIDSAKGGPSAFGTLTGVRVTSETAPALSITPKPAEARQPGGEKKVTRGSVDLTEPYEDVTVDSAVLNGTLGVGEVTSEADGTAASSSVSAVLTSATLAGALAKVEGATSTVQAKSLASRSEGVRTVSVDEVVVLDLGALLDALGIDLLDLPVATVVGLLDDLDIEVDGIGDAAAVNAVIDDLQADITDLADETSVPPGTVTEVVDAINNLGLGVLVDPAAEDVIEAADPVAQVNALVDELQAALVAVLTEGVQALDDEPLLVVQGAQAGVTTKALDTPEAGMADATGGIGAIQVGGLRIDGVDVIDGVEAVAGTVTNVNNALEKALGGIDPGLADLVHVSLFDRATERGVTTGDGYVRAADGITVLTASVRPPDTLDAIRQAIEDQTGIGEAIEVNDGTAPPVDDAMDELEALLGTSAPAGLSAASGGLRAAALGDGLTVRIADIAGTSEFRPAQAAPDGNGPGDPADSSASQDGEDPANELPRTGDDSLRLTALATLLIALGLGCREWLRMPAPAWVHRTR